MISTKKKKRNWKRSCPNEVCLYRIYIRCWQTDMCNLILYVFRATGDIQIWFITTYCFGNYLYKVIPKYCGWCTQPPSGRSHKPYVYMRVYKTVQGEGKTVPSTLNYNIFVCNRQWCIKHTKYTELIYKQLHCTHNVYLICQGTPGNE